MSGISGLGSNAAPSGSAKAPGGTGGNTTSTVTDANGSTTTTVTGPTGSVLSVSTVAAQASAVATPPGGTGSPASAGLLNISA